MVIKITIKPLRVWKYFQFCFNLSYDLNVNCCSQVYVRHQFQTQDFF